MYFFCKNTKLNFNQNNIWTKWNRTLKNYIEFLKYYFIIIYVTFYILQIYLFFHINFKNVHNIIITITIVTFSGLMSFELWYDSSTGSMWTRGIWTYARCRGDTPATRPTVRPTYKWCRCPRPPARSPRVPTSCTCRFRSKPEAALAHLATVTKRGAGRRFGTTAASVRQNPRLWPALTHPTRVWTL